MDKRSIAEGQLCNRFGFVCGLARRPQAALSAGSPDATEICKYLVISRTCMFSNIQIRSPKIREKGNLRVHWILNLNKVLQILQDHRVTLLNISSEDIVSGNPKLTLSLIWLIALNFDGRQLHVVPTENTLESSLLKWVQSLTKPFGVQVKDFSTSWSDGRAFLYLMLDSVADFNLDEVLKRHPIER